MRIAHIFSRFKTYSGAEHLCFRWLREGIRYGDRLTVITRYLPSELVDHVPDDVNVRTLRWAHVPTRYHFLESICDVLYSPFLFFLVPNDTDVDVYWNDNTLASLFLDSLVRRKPRVFYCLQLPHFAYGQTGLVTRSYPPLSWLVPLLVPMYRWLDRLFARRADSIVAISKMVSQDCRRVYRRSVVPTAGPGIDLPRSGIIGPLFIRRTLPVKTDQVLLTAGKLIPKKNFDMFVRVVHMLRRDGLDVTGVIIGDGPLRERILGLIRSLDLEGYCLMTGFVEAYDDVLRLMSGATIYVYLERNVPFGLTPLEAGSVGVPTVTFAGGGVEETIVDGENGCKLPIEYGAEEVAAAVGALLSGPAEELSRLGRNGRVHAQRWTWDRSYERFRKHVASVAVVRPK